MTDHDQDLSGMFQRFGIHVPYALMPSKMSPDVEKAAFRRALKPQPPLWRRLLLEYPVYWWVSLRSRFKR